MLKQQKINPSLDKIKEALTILKEPQNNYKVIHIAGTNGKGSCCSFLELLYLNSKEKHPYKKIGKYTSPHLLSVTERFSINAKDIEQKDFDSYWQKLFTAEDAPLKEIELTYFEQLTALAFLFFKEQGCDLVILETGLGGRWDATNTCLAENTLATAITNISFDHMDYLGDSLDKIRTEKEGIKKDNVPHFEGDDYKPSDKNISPNSSSGENFLLALDIFETLNSTKLSSEHKLEIIENFKARYLGRFQFHAETNTLIDGAHNEAAAFKLKAFIDDKFNETKKYYIIGILDKDYKSYLNALIKDFGPKDHIFFTAVDSSRSLSSLTLKEYCLESLALNPAQVEAFSSLNECLKSQMLASRASDTLLVVSGSLYLVAEYLKLKL